MDERAVAEAVRTLVDRGEPISVRRILGLIGGSSRDVQKHLRALKPGMTRVEIDTTADCSPIPSASRPFSPGPSSAGWRRSTA